MSSEVIGVDLIDNVNLRIECDISQAFELKEFFSCYVPNYKFNPKYKARMWDGKISFFNVHDRTLPIGLLKFLKPFLVKYGYKIQFLFDRKVLTNDIEREDLIPFYDALFDGLKIYPRDYQQEAIYSALKHKRGVLESATGCHSKGTKIVMWDGTLKSVEDVIVGDTLMGIDNTPRNVQRLYRGVEPMYKITPNKGESFTVNENHILHLRFTSDKCRSATKYNSSTIDISVKDYLNQTKTFKHESKLEFNDIELDFGCSAYNGGLDPYFIGLYLGDGHTHSCAITTMDEEVVDYIYEVSSKFNSNIRVTDTDSLAKTYNFSGFRGKHHPILEEFHDIGLHFGKQQCYNRTTCNIKHVPDVLKYGSKEQRYGILAGIIDSDGTLSKSSYDVVLSSSVLRDDVSYIARSLGYFVTESVRTINDVEYYRANIQGDISKIPIRISRKKYTSSLARNKRVNVHGFKIDKVDDGEFYGFELDNDHLYFTGDFCIHHNSGKSLIIYSLIRFMMEDVEGKILLVVPSINLVNQMFSDFREYGWYDSYDDVTLLYGKSKNYDPNKKVLISTWQSIYKKSPGFFKQFGGVLVDETHGAKSASIQTVLKKCANAEYKIGLTGTLPTEKVDRYNIFGYLGPVIYKLKSKELIDRGYLTDIRIVNMHVRYSNSDIQLNKNQTYQEELDLIINKPERQKVIKSIIDGKHVGDDQNVLILAQRINHIDNIVEYLQQEYPNKEILRIDGKTDPDERERVRKYVESNDGIILVATYGTLSTGVNIPKIHHVIFASFYKSKIKVLQSIGRGLRKHKSKNIIIIWDLIDDMRWEKQQRKNTKEKMGLNYAYQHFLERLTFYQEQGFRYVNKKISLEGL